MPRTAGLPARIVFALLFVSLAVPAHADLHPTVAAAWDLLRAGKFREALGTLQRTSPSEWSTADHVEAAIVQASASRALGEPRDAERFGQAALEHARRGDSPGLLASALMLLGDLAADRHDLERAGALLQQSSEAATRHGDRRQMAEVLMRLGRHQRATGQGEASLASYARALDALRGLGQPGLESSIHVSRSTALLGRGEYDRALAEAQAGHDRAHEAKRPHLVAAAVFALAQVHAHIRDLDRAADLWTESIDAYRAINGRLGEALATRQRMDTWFALNDFERAIADGEAALALLSKTESAGILPALLGRLALSEARLGRRDKSVQRRREALAAAAAVAGPARLQLDLDLALAALDGGEIDEARQRFDGVLAAARALGDPDYEWRALYGLGRADRAAGRRAEAERRQVAAVQLIERQRRMLPEAGQRAAFLGDRLGPYEALIATKLDSADETAVAAALEVAEQARARAMADLLAEARARQTKPALAEIQEGERQFARRLSSLQKELADAASGPARDRLERQLVEAEREFDAFAVRVRRENPAYAALAHPRTLTAPEVAAIPQAGEALVVFWTGAEVSVAWTIRGGRIALHRLPGRADLDRAVRVLLGLVRTDDRAALAEASARLYETLLGPADLAGVERLIVVPDGPLLRLPFALLRRGGPAGAPLVEHMAIQLAPSATLLAELRSLRTDAARRQAAVFAFGGRPDHARVMAPDLVPLAAATGEARAIARVLDAARTETFVGDAATEAAVRQAVTEPRGVLHFASHAVVDDAVPRRSAIVLAPSSEDDGLLQLNEVANLQLDAALVVLSACRSFVGRTVRGEGFLSLSRAFLYAGARSVAASLWDVDDRATDQLMRLFYRALAEGAPADRALQTAQRQMIARGGVSAAPASWASFVISGDAGVAIAAAPSDRGPAVAPVAALTLLALALAAGVSRARRRATAAAR